MHFCLKKKKKYDTLPTELLWAMIKNRPRYVIGSITLILYVCKLLELPPTRVL